MKLISLLILLVSLAACSPGQEEGGSISPFIAGVSNPDSLDAGGSSTAATSITTNSVSPTANALLLLTTFTVNNPQRTHNTPTDTFTGTGSWTDEVNASEGFGHITLAWAIAGDAPGSGTVSQSFSGEAIRSSYILAEVTGFDRGTPIRENNSGNGTASTLSISLTDLINGTLPYGAVGSIGASSGITAGSGETKLAEIYPGGSNEAGQQSQYGDGTEDTTFNWSGLNTTGNAGVVIEINSDPGVIMIGQRAKVRILAYKLPNEKEVVL